MCGRFTLDIDERFYPRFKLEKVLTELTPHFNIAPNQDSIIVFNHEGKNEAKLMRWGLIPFWAKEEKLGLKLINAKIETLHIKNPCKHALAHGRCIVPASGFYEWKQEEDGKQPYYIYPADNGYFALAGLYETWKEPLSQKELQTFSIITTSPTKQMSEIHNRMPLILDSNLEAEWLKSTNPETLLSSLPFYETTTAIAMHKVSKKVNSPANDDRSLIETIP